MPKCLRKNYSEVKPTSYSELPVSCGRSSLSEACSMHQKKKIYSTSSTRQEQASHHIQVKSTSQPPAAVTSSSTPTTTVRTSPKPTQVARTEARGKHHDGNTSSIQGVNEYVLSRQFRSQQDVQRSQSQRVYRWGEPIP